MKLRHSIKNGYFYLKINVQLGTRIPKYLPCFVLDIRPSGLPKAVVRAEVSFAVFGAWNQASPRLSCEREIHFYLVQSLGWKGRIQTQGMH